ncbi:tetratricopeptide repeat protein [Streptomyces virginiae]|uniref:tetratricopeptide repeat protein n=1 Tax=Streptomyces virginiae TaxID=1961 RepID=UPI0036A1D8E7
MGAKGNKGKKRNGKSGVPAQRSGARGAAAPGPGQGSDFTGSRFTGSAAQQYGQQYNTFVQQYAPAPSALDALQALPPEFTGRDEDLAPLLDLLAPDSGTERPVAVVAGMGGVGKTTLAHAVGHEVLKRGWFTGVLLVDLRGYDPQPAQPEQSLDALLRRLGVQPEHIPPTGADREVFYRSHLAERGRKGERLLVIADNASSAAQVKPLLPPAPHAMVATSRRALPGIGRPRTLHQLQPDDAVALLALALREANPEDRRVEEDREAAERVATACGCLPLALQIVAALLVQDPDQPLAERAERLAAGNGRLDSINDGERDLRAVFGQTFDSLLPQQQDLFRMLSLNAGPDISTPAAAALTHHTETAIDNQLGQLAAAHLITRGTTRGRWQMHDLLRDYAVEQTQAHLKGNRTARRKYDQARERLTAHYVKRAEGARTHIDLAKYLQPSPEFEDREQAFRWVDEERATLIAMAHLGAPSRESARICFALTEYLQYRELRDEALVVGALSLDSVRTLKDRRNEAGAWGNLGYALHALHRYDEAHSAQSTARGLYEQLGDIYGQAVIWTNIGITSQRVHRYDEARAAHVTARGLFRQLSDPWGEAGSWCNEGNALESLHRYDEALAAHVTARGLYEQAGDTRGRARAWNNTGDVLREMHRYGEALAAHVTARGLCEEAADSRGQAMTWNNIGAILRGLHRYDEALAAHVKALGLFEETGDTLGQASAWINTGITRRAVHRYEEALTAHDLARGLYEQFGDVAGQALAWDKKGNALESLHRYEEALTAHATARGLYEQAGDIRGQVITWGNTGATFQGLCRYAEALTAHSTARDLTEQLGDVSGQAMAWDNIGAALHGLYRYDEAFAAHDTARGLCEQVGDVRGEAIARGNAGNVLESLHRYGESLTAHVTARGLYEQVGDVRGQAIAWDNIGDALRELHRHDEALAAHDTARGLFEECGDSQGRANAWHRAGGTLLSSRRYEEALTAHATAHALYEQFGDLRDQAKAVNSMGNVLRELNRHDESLAAHATARGRYEQAGDSDGQAVAWDSTGLTLQSLQRYDEALAAHATARGLLEQVGDVYGQAITWNNTGTAHRGLRRHQEALAFGRRAVEKLEELGDFTRAGEALGELATSLEAAGAGPDEVKATWLRSAGAYDRAGAAVKRDESRAKAEAVGGADA